MSLDILIVDDHEPMRAMLRTVLTRAGAHVREAASAEEALEAMAARSADIVLCDHNMQAMSGLELVRRLRASPAHAGARVLMVSGRTEFAFAEAARAAGADGVLTKPIAPRALLQAIADLMRPAADARATIQA